MNGHRAIVGLCMLCALLVSAFAAQSASAINGTTAVTCSESAEVKDKVGAHCLDIVGAEKKFGHIPIAQDKTTELTGTNKNTKNNTAESSNGLLRVTIGGVPLQLEATGVSGTGWMKNEVNASKEHYAHGKGTITFEGVTVKEPAGRGCQVFTDNEATKTEGEVGVVHTRELTATTEGVGTNLKFTPAEGASFANFFVTCEEGKKIPALEGTWECTGSVKGQPSGATTNFTEAATTAENTLKCKGNKAGITGSLTLSGRDPAAGGAFTPLATTTITT